MDISQAWLENQSREKRSQDERDTLSFALESCFCY